MKKDHIISQMCLAYKSRYRYYDDDEIHEIMRFLYDSCLKQYLEKQMSNKYYKKIRRIINKMKKFKEQNNG